MGDREGNLPPEAAPEDVKIAVEGAPSPPSAVGDQAQAPEASPSVSAIPVIPAPGEMWKLDQETAGFDFTGAAAKPSEAPRAAMLALCNKPGAPLEVFGDKSDAADLEAAAGAVAAAVAAAFDGATPSPADRTVQAHVAGQAADTFAPRWQFGGGMSWSGAQSGAPTKLLPRARVIVHGTTAEEAAVGYTALLLSGCNNNSVAARSSVFALGYLQLAAGCGGRHLDANPATTAAAQASAVSNASLEAALAGSLEPDAYRAYSLTLVTYLVEKFGLPAFLAFCKGASPAGDAGGAGAALEDVDRASVASFQVPFAMLERTLAEAGRADGVASFLGKLGEAGGYEMEKKSSMGAWQGLAADEPVVVKNRSVEAGGHKPSLRQIQKTQSIKSITGQDRVLEAKQEEGKVFTLIDSDLWCIDVLPKNENGGIAAAKMNSGKLCWWVANWMYRNQPKLSMYCAFWMSIIIFNVAATPFVIRRIFDVYMKEDPPDILWIGIMVCFLIVGSLLKAQALWGMRCHSPGGAHFLPEMHFSLVRHVLASRQLFIDGANLSHLMATLNNALPVVNGTIDVFMKLILFVSEFVILMAVLFILNWQLTLAISCCAPIYAVYAHRKGPQVEVANKAVGDRGKFVFGHVEENMRCTSSKRLYGLWEELEEDIVSEEKAWSSAFANYYRVWAESNRGLNILELLIGLVVLCVGAFLVSQEKLALGGFISYYIASGRVAGLLNTIATNARSFNTGKVAFCRLIPLISEKEDQYDRTASIKPTSRFDLELRDVVMKYGERVILNGFSVTIPQGFKVGIVGRSGAGKSTTLKIMSRLYQPVEGGVFVGGIPINAIALPDVIATMEQDNVIFNRSVRDNIGLGGEYTDQDILEAMEVANLVEDVMSLEKGLDSPCGYAGKAFSGGQRQRICLARAAIRNTPILLLDEPAASQDQNGVLTIGNNLKNMMWTDANDTKHPVTVIAVTHSKVLADGWDAMLVVSEGRCAEFGPAADLMALNGKFASIINSTAGMAIGKGGKVTLAADRVSQFWMFAALPNEHLQMIADEFMTRKMGEKEKLFEIGTEIDQLVLLVDGVIEELEPDDGGEDGTEDEFDADGKPKVKEVVVNDAGGDAPGKLRRKQLWTGGDSAGADILVADMLAYPVQDTWETTGQANIKGTIAVTLTTEAFGALLESDEQLCENVKEMIHNVESARSPSGLELIWMFVGLEEDELRIIGAKFKIQVFEKGALLFNWQDDPISSLYILTTGSVSMVTDYNPKRDDASAFASNLVPRTSFGERALMGPSAGRTFTATATSRSVLLVLNKSRMHDIYETNPEIKSKIDTMVALEKDSRQPAKLAANWLLGAGTPKVLDIVAEILASTVLSYAEGALLDIDAMYQVLHGAVLVGYTKADGTIESVMHHAGDFINETGLLEEVAGSSEYGVKIASIETASKAVLQMCPRTSLRSLLDANGKTGDIKAMQKVAARAQQLRAAKEAAGLGIGQFRPDQREFLAITWKMLCCAPGKELDIPKGSELLFHVLAGEVAVSEEGSSAEPSKKVAAGGALWTPGAARLVDKSSMNKAHPLAITRLMRPKGAAGEHTVVIVMDLGELSAEAEKRRLEEQAAARAEQELRAKLRDEASSLYNQVVRFERRLGLRPHFHPAKAWRRGFRLFQASCAVGLVDKSTLHRPLRDSAAQLQEEVDRYKERLEDLEPMVAERLTSLLAKLGEWRRLGMRKAKIVLWAERLVKLIESGKMPAPAWWQGGGGGGGEAAAPAEHEEAREAGGGVDAAYWKGISSHWDKDSEEYDISLARLEDMGEATARLLDQRASQLKRRHDGLGALWDLIGCPEEYRANVLDKSQVAEPEVFVFLDREIDAWNMKLVPMIEALREEMKGFWQRMLTPVAERTPWLQPEDLEEPTMTVYLDHKTHRDELENLVNIVEPIMGRLSSRGQEGLVANIDSLYHARINELRRQAQFGSADIPMEVMKNWTVAECRAELEEMQHLLDEV